LLLQPKAHFVIVDQFAPVGLRDAFPDSGDETAALLCPAQGGIFHEKLGVHAGMCRDTGKLGFLLGTEMHFHA
jgi:hypothetical protein